MEADLGTPLFDRSQRRLKLTPAGERLLDYAGELLDLAEEARSAVATLSGTVSGRLRVGGLETLCAARLPELLAEYRREYPKVELSLKSANSGQLRSGMKSGELDVSFFFGEAVATAEMASEQVAQEGLVVIAPADHRLAGCESVDTGDLIDDAFLVTERGCVYRRMFDAAFAATLPDRPRLVGEFASLAAIRSLVGAGLGCALVPRLVVPEGERDVVVLPWKDKSRAAPVLMAWRRRRIQPPPLSAFLAVARRHFA
ncbi:hypothetical protein LCM4579_26425 [Ensifer sp. LCM 4579]|nr:hypothetical protein LCM4579_26425 [Ensifer sp. LCM 4579]